MGNHSLFYLFIPIFLNYSDYKILKGEKIAKECVSKLLRESRVNPFMLEKNMRRYVLNFYHTILLSLLSTLSSFNIFNNEKLQFRHGKKIA
jgi:hypothetical protein